ncbi:MAG: hypothetical protein GXX94_11045 [Chloroflexi bacterium]|nr:hypothetical protein [Chloroflexota bacterium]
MSSNSPELAATDASDDIAQRQALFPGLVYSEDGHEARVTAIGGVAHYAIPEHGFLRHVEARHVDEAVIQAMQEQMASIRDELVAGLLEAMQTDDILTKAALEASIDNVGASLRRSDPSQWAPMLRLYGFRIIVDVHGDVREIIYPHPAGSGAEDDDG